MNLNFDEVESANGEVRESTFKSVKPGLNTLMISAVEPTVAGTGSAGVVVTFESKEAEASFNHRFWLTAKTLPKLQYLVEKFTGAKMTGSFPGEGLELAQSVSNALSGKLIGKSKTVVVDGEKRTKEKDGKVYVNVYPTLRFAGYVDPEGKSAEPIIKDLTDSQPTSKAVNVSVEDDDLPF